MRSGSSPCVPDSVHRVGRWRQHSRVRRIRPYRSIYGGDLKRTSSVAILPLVFDLEITSSPRETVNETLSPEDESIWRP